VYGENDHKYVAPNLQVLNIKYVKNISVSNAVQSDLDLKKTTWIS